MQRLRTAIGLALALTLISPARVMATADAAAGAITLLAHIDFVARYSAKDDGDGGTKIDDWNGYETYNLEFAVLGLAGRLGANVDWVITEAFAFAGPFGPLNSLLAGTVPDYNPNPVTASLLDARINLHLGDLFMISAGRFIPPTSMTWNPHLLPALLTINYPLLNGSGFQNVFIPLPMYQTGIMLTLLYEDIKVEIGSFNGSNIVGGADYGGLNVLSVNNILDLDKSKGTSIKLSADDQGAHLGLWVYSEGASLRVQPAPRYIIGLTPGTLKTADAYITQVGLEFALFSPTGLFQFQGLQTTVDFQDHNALSPLGGKLDQFTQQGWYALLGFQVQPYLQLVARYDYFDYDNGKVIATEKNDVESATTVGLNFLVDEGTSVAVDYTFRSIEGWNANQNELAILLETNLFPFP